MELENQFIDDERKKPQSCTHKSRLSLDRPLSEAPDENIGSFLNCSSPLNMGGSLKLNMLSMRSGGTPKSEVDNRSSVSIEKMESRKAPSAIQSSVDCRWVRERKCQKHGAYESRGYFTIIAQISNKFRT